MWADYWPVVLVFCSLYGALAVLIIYIAWAGY